MPNKTIAIQLDSIAPANEGVERVLDEVQTRASVNVLMIDSLWFTDAVGPADLTKHDLRGHVRDAGSGLVGGRMGFVDPRYYHDTGVDLAPLTRRTGTPDILAAMCAGAKKRGMKVIPIIKDMVPAEAPGHEKMCEYDFNGQRAETSCKANPFYRRLLNGVMEDMIRSYDVDGIMYIAERQGPFMDTLGLRFRGIKRGLPGSRTCFCEHCQATARNRGINIAKAKAGFEELAKFTAAGRARQRPVDGYYVTLWRLILRHPELLAWEHMWHENLRGVYQQLHRQIKAVRPSVEYGVHIWPNINENPLLSAEHDLTELAPSHDFIKLSLYSNAGGPRMGSYIDSVSQTMFGDLPPDEALRFNYRVLNYDEAPLQTIRQTGLKNDFVYRECKRGMEAVRGTKAALLAGLDIDIPTDIEKRDGLADPAVTTRDDVKKIVRQAFQAGVPGIVISRQYSEMSLDNLGAVNDGLREAGIIN
ncbi:MAG TPA: hypothetical protein VM029_22020 [Opitutaceae bacterium]|nr:hypothetical protein [Opitutaceae bacterium]